MGVVSTETACLTSFVFTLKWGGEAAACIQMLSALIGYAFSYGEGQLNRGEVVSGREG